MSKKPWEERDLIKSNLEVFAGLKAGEKLKNYNNEGKFAKSKVGLFQGLHRSKSDSIINLSAGIVKVFIEARKREIPYIDALNGIRILRATYKGKIFKKRSKLVDEIIAAVEDLDKDFANDAFAALQIARTQIKWSINKVYQKTTDMSKKASSVAGGMGIHRLPPKDLSKVSAQERMKIIEERWIKAEGNKTREDAFNDMLSLGVGNCLEMSKVAFNHLKSKNKSVARMHLGKGKALSNDFDPIIYKGDHVFLLVGQCFHDFDESGNKITDSNLKIKSVFQFNKGVYVCDPWANIVCPVNMYAAMWEAKMSKWSRNQKYILVGKQDRTGEYLRHKKTGGMKMEEIDPFNYNYKHCISITEWIIGEQYFSTASS
jgi:hypothetical protein